MHDFNSSNKQGQFVKGTHIGPSIGQAREEAFILKSLNISR